MTPFLKWCDENGYDPKGDFVVIKGISEVNAGDLVSLAYDDGTEVPRFNTPAGPFYLGLVRLTQHKTEPKMTEKKLPIPRMVEVRDYNNQDWVTCELLADLSGKGLEFPYICRSTNNKFGSDKFKQMREIPQPKTRPMTPRELLDAIRNGAVWSYDREIVSIAWTTNIVIEQTWLCYDWHGTDSDVWVKAEVTE